MRLYIFVIITVIVYWGECRHWSHIRSYTKPYKGRTGLPTIKKSKQEKPARPVKNEPNPSRRYLRSAYLQPRNKVVFTKYHRKPARATTQKQERKQYSKYFHRKTVKVKVKVKAKKVKARPDDYDERSRYYVRKIVGVGTGDNIKEIEGDISLDNGRRMPLVLPLVYQHQLLKPPSKILDGGTNKKNTKAPKTRPKQSGRPQKKNFKALKIRPKAGGWPQNKNMPQRRSMLSGRFKKKNLRAPQRRPKPGGVGPQNKKGQKGNWAQWVKNIMKKPWKPGRWRTTTTKRTRKRFNPKIFNDRAWGRTRRPTTPPPPVPTKYSMQTPDFLGTGKYQWTYDRYEDSKWKVFPIWEEYGTVTDHYIGAHTDATTASDYYYDWNQSDIATADWMNASFDYNIGNNTFVTNKSVLFFSTAAPDDTNVTKDYMSLMNGTMFDYRNFSYNGSVNEKDKEFLDKWTTLKLTRKTRRTTTVCSRFRENVCTAWLYNVFFLTEDTRGVNDSSEELTTFLSTIETRSTNYKHPTMQNTRYYHYKDYFLFDDKIRVRQLAAELLRDAIIKIQQVTSIKDESMYSTAFEVGYVVGVIREKYRRLMATYTEIMDRVRRRTRIISASYYWNIIRPVHLLVYYEWIHNLEKEIDYLVEALEEIPEEETGMTEATILFRAKARREMEARGDMNIRAQEKLKSQYRQEFLMRRLGLPRNLSTARRRFVNKWPVEETWDHTPLYW